MGKGLSGHQRLKREADLLKMNWYKNNNHLEIGRIGISYWEEWSELLTNRKINFKNFTFIHFYIERCYRTYQTEFEFGLLGFNLRITLKDKDENFY